MRKILPQARLTDSMTPPLLKVMTASIGIVEHGLNISFLLAGFADGLLEVCGMNFRIFFAIQYFRYITDADHAKTSVVLIGDGSDIDLLADQFLLARAAQAGTNGRRYTQTPD